MRFSKCFLPLVVIESGNSAFPVLLLKVTLLTSKKAFLLFFVLTKRKSNLVFLPNFFSALTSSYLFKSSINLFFNASSMTLLVMWVFIQNLLPSTSIIWRVYFNFLLSFLDSVNHTGLPYFKRLNIEPEFGQWAVMILFFNLISAKNRLYLFIKTPGINSFSKSIFLILSNYGKKK